ncbi:MAG TPA: hypothetical protein VF590_09145 [Isosphaeraceae bacterium]|jgi:hypothetical protein
MAATTARDAAGPILIGIDDDSWTGHLDRVERWLRHVVVVQAEFRTLAADTATKIREPHWHEYLTRIAEAAVEHEHQAAEMFRVIGRDPARTGTLAGTVMAKAREGLADLVGLATGASAPWRDVQQLFLVSLGAIGAFGVAEQLGYAIGIPALAEIAFGVTVEKFKHHRLLQEAVLEFAALAILYDSELGDPAAAGQGVAGRPAT